MQQRLPAVPAFPFPHPTCKGWTQLQEKRTHGCLPCFSTWPQQSLVMGKSPPNPPAWLTSMLPCL